MNETLELTEIPERQICVLRAMGELTLADRAEFNRLAERLMDSGLPKRVIDLSRISRLFSLYMGTLADLGQRAQAAKKNLTVLLSPRIAKLLQQANLDTLVQIVVVEPDAP